MRINYKISIDELVNFHTKYVTETKNYKYAIIGNTIFMLLLIFLVFMLSKSSFYTISTLIMCFVCLLFRKRYMIYGIRKRLRKIFSFEKYNNYFEATTLIIDENGLNLSTNLSQRAYKWISLKSLYLIDNYVFIRTNTHDDILIPIDSFSLLKDKDFFINTIINNTNLVLKNTYPIDFKYQ
ncbi:hypothetical protein [Clostridium hydrogenum]|uniref:hypothetical protein n=1 Tax=Clostridium hydrogenum TaxID=2855764 RepID=UPI001F2187F5|nr:hypothetical protein [Clostridium hydrogenum]